MDSIILDKGTISMILDDYYCNSMTIEELSDKYGIAEGVVTDIVIRTKNSILR